MQILDEQDYFAGMTMRLEKLLKKIPRAHADKRSVQATKRAGRRKPEQVEKEVAIFPRREAETRQTFLDLGDNCFTLLAGGESERMAHDLYKGQKRRLLAIGRTAAAQDGDCCVGDPPRELV